MQKRDKAMATTAIRLNKELVDKAQAYATAEGKSLSSIIEDFLSRLTDINGRKAYYGHLEQKHQ